MVRGLWGIAAYLRFAGVVRVRGMVDGAVVSSCCVDWGCVWRDLCGVVCGESGMRVHLRFAGAGRVQDIRDAGISWNRRSGTGMMRESCKIMGCP